MASMKHMQALNPQLEKITRKFQNDKLKLAHAQSEFYKQKGINPGSGCLPYILQFIILIAFFNVFTRTVYNGVDITQKFNEMLYNNLQSIIKYNGDLTLITSSPASFMILGS